MADTAMAGSRHEPLDCLIGADSRPAVGLLAPLLFMASGRVSHIRGGGNGACDGREII